MKNSITTPAHSFPIIDQVNILPTNVTKVQSPQDIINSIPETHKNSKRKVQGKVQAQKLGKKEVQVKSVNRPSFVDVIDTNTQLTEKHMNKVIHVDGSKGTIQLILPKITKRILEWAFTFKRTDSGCSGNDVLIFPHGPDMIEKGSVDGSWIPNIGSCFGVGFSDVVKMGNDGYDNWYFIQKPSIDTIRPITNSMKVSDLDRTMLVTANEDTTLTLPTTVGIDGRMLNIKNNPVSFCQVIIKPVGSQLIDGNTILELKPGECRGIISDGSNWHIMYGYSTN